jgi:ADP-heptose:LPS heptosyltransferase
MRWTLLGPIYVLYFNESLTQNRYGLLWNLKFSLKIIVLLWYLQRGVILTKDNLEKRGWKGSLKYSFCNQNKRIQHLFYCCLARIIWRIIFFAFHLDKPSSINHIMGDWESDKGAAHKKKLLIGVAAMFWTI